MMYQQLYMLTIGLFSLGVGLYVYVSYQLSRDIDRGLVPVRLEEKPN